MNIVVSEIPDSGMWVEFHGNDFVWEGLKGLNVTRYPEGKFFVEKSNTAVFVKGQVHAELRLICSRCLEEFPFPVDPEVRYTLQPRVPVLDREIELTPEDLEYSYYDDDHIEIERLIEEPIVLAIPIKPLCHEDCLGLCPVCGENKNMKHCTCIPHSQTSVFSILKAYMKDNS